MVKVNERGENNDQGEDEKVLTLSSPPHSELQLNKLIEAVCPPDEESNYLDSSVNDENGELIYSRKKSEN